MKRRVLVACVVVFSMSVSGHALAAGCDGLANKMSQAKSGNAKVGGLISKLTVLFGGTDPTPANVDCSSVVVAVQNLISPARTGGRALEPSASLDRAAAQAELDSALQKPQVQQAIEAIHQRSTDEDVRLLLEAAVFDEDGSYAARDLRLAQLRERLGS